MCDALLLSHLLSGSECLDGGGGLVWHLITREEATEMEWGVGKMVLDEPTAHLTNHVHIIVDIRNDEVGEFYPHPGFVHGEDGVEYGL